MLQNWGTEVKVHIHLTPATLTFSIYALYNATYLTSFNFQENKKKKINGDSVTKFLNPHVNYHPSQLYNKPNKQWKSKQNWQCTKLIFQDFKCKKSLKKINKRGKCFATSLRIALNIQIEPTLFATGVMYLCNCKNCTKKGAKGVASALVMYTLQYKIHTYYSPCF